MKRICYILSIVICMLLMSACTSNINQTPTEPEPVKLTEVPSTPTENPQVTEPVKEADVPPTKAPEVSPTPTKIPQVTETEENNETEEEEMPETTFILKQAPEEEAAPIRDISSLDLVKEIKVGWNLGNTMDAVGNGLEAETAWGSPKTTKEMIQAVKAGGFNTIRIPITWMNHYGEAPDYKIDSDWMARVQEVVNYSYEEGLFTIINIHHEGWIIPTEEGYQETSTILKALWSQIADQFKNYDEYLIFEGMNEPRLVGSSIEWTGGDSAGRKVVNKLNADFVATVRSTGGNNGKRHLMIPAYGANPGKEPLRAMEFPEGGNLIASIHAYTPYNFALNVSGTDSFSKAKSGDTKDIDWLFQCLKEELVDKGIPVILGECGAMNKNGNVESRVEWVEYYFGKAKKLGIPCVWWDNGSVQGNGELFGLFNRMELTWVYPEVHEAIMRTVGIK